MLTAADYLSWERRQLDKYEFHRGEIVPASGRSHRHNYLSAAVSAELRAAVRGKGYYAFSSKQRIAAEPGKLYVYADAVLAHGDFRSEPGTTDVLANPAIVAEVLSPSTEAHDRGLKWEAYRQLPSLTDYLLLSESTARVEHFQRVADGWLYRALTAGGTITLANGATIPVDAIYEGAFEVEAG